MFKSIYTYSSGIIAIALLIGCESTTTVSTGGTTTTQCRELQPIFKKLDRKYATSKDDYVITAYRGSKGSGGSGGTHNQGRNCLACHRFASAGTVFPTLHAGNNSPGSAGYRIKLSTGIVYGAARGTGNSRASSFPSGNFTAQVIDPNGNIVNSSAEMSHDASRRACNSCHSSSGNNGAPGRITSARLSAAPVTSNATACVSFNQNVLPVLTAKCKVCHGSNGRFSVTTANETYANIKALKGSITASATYLVQKASNTVGHGGGKVISPTSAEYTTIKAWVTEGGLNN